MRPAILAIIMLEICGLCWGQKVRFNPASEAEVVDRARKAPPDDHGRAQRIKALFRETGCTALREQNVDGLPEPNIICELHGDASRTIIVGAHYEAPAVPGSIDNWSAAAALPGLYQCLKGAKRNHRILFVAFADRAGHAAGAEYFAAHLSDEEIRNTQAMINLDVLGFSPTKVWASHSNKDLLHSLVIMVYTLKLPVSRVEIHDEADDSEPFAARNIPQITLHSLTRQHLEGTAAMQFRPANYYDSYRLICGYIAYLDKTLKSRPHAGSEAK